MDKLKCVKCQREWSNQECAILDGALDGQICIAGIEEYQFTCVPCRENRNKTGEVKMIELKLNPGKRVILHTPQGNVEVSVWADNSRTDISVYTENGKGISVDDNLTTLRKEE